MDVLVTAGGTRNPIDAMRSLAAGSSGMTGIAIGEALVAQGHSVWMLGSREARLRAPHLPGEEFGSTRDLMARMEAWVRAHPDGAIVHSAAVGDYEVATPDSGKVPSGRAVWTLTLTPTPKIADHVRPWGSRGLYVTFKAAAPGTTPDELIEIARRQRDRTGCDYVFANVLGQIDHGIAWVGDAVEWFDTRADALVCLVGALTRHTVQ